MTNTTPKDLQARMEKLVRDIVSAWHFEDGLYSGHLLSGAEDAKPYFLKALEAYWRIKADRA